jgi:hypothetical protein
MFKIFGKNATNHPLQSSGVTPEYEAYLVERASKLELSERQQQFLDQSLLTLSGGGLGLTLAFLHDHGAVTIRVWMAGIGIGSLILSLVAVLMSLYTSQESISSHVDALDEHCGAGFPKDRDASKRLQENLWARLTGNVNLVAGGAFLLGAIMLSLFVISNLNTGDQSGGTQNMSSNSQGGLGRTPIERGAVIKPPPVKQPQQSQSMENKK